MLFAFLLTHLFIINYTFDGNLLNKPAIIDGEVYYIYEMN